IEITDGNECKNSIAGLLINSSSALDAGSLAPISSFCANENVTPVFKFQTLPSGGSGNFTYKWTKGTESAVLGTDASYTPSLPTENGKYIPGIYTYTVTIIDQADQNCGTVSLPAVVVVKPQPAVVLNASSAKSCDEDVTFTATGAKTGETYVWSNAADGTFVADGSTKTLTYNASGDKIQSATWYVKVKDANGCESESAEATAKTYIPPVAAISSVLGQCSYTLSANLTGTAYSYSCSGAKSVTESTIEANATGTYDLTITETYSDGHTCTSNTASKAITISDVTLPTISYTKVCDGLNATLNLNNTVADYSYGWKKKVGSSAKFETAGSGTSLSVNEAGNYKVVVTTTQNCVDSTDAIPVEFHSLPTPEIVKVNSDDYLCADGVALTLKTTESYKSYKWSTTATTATINVTTAGNYTVEVTDDNGCKATSNDFVAELHTLPVLADITDKTVCAGVKADFTLTLATETEGEYTYNVSTFASQTSNTFSLGKGDYSATVTDKFGCTS
ncbi:MAG: hypothetical protein IJ263_07700, partial [Paludibacteraceae bacterium]|nr:hypothetical protein [Paludibacteraceae bacterium]